MEEKSIQILGVSFKKSIFISIICFLSLALVCAVIYSFLGKYVPEYVPPVSYPKGNLSDSIFVAQNMTYSQIDALTEAYQVPSLPVLIDMINGSKAINNDVAIFTFNDKFFFVTVCDRGDDYLGKIVIGLSNAVDFSAKAEDLSVYRVSEEKGFINGCSATYSNSYFTIRDLNETYMAVYALDISEEVLSNDKTLIIGCAGKEYTTEGLEALKNNARLVVGTLRVDPSKVK